MTEHKPLNPQAIPDCKHIEPSKIKALGGEVDEDTGISTIVFQDHFHIQWDIKIEREGYLKIYKNPYGHFTDLWNDIAKLQPVFNKKKKKGLYCDYEIAKTPDTDWFYTVVYVAEKFSADEIMYNLFIARKDPPRYHILDFKGRLREPLPEPEKSKVESLEEALLEEIEMQKVKKKYIPKIQTGKIESQFNYKDTLKKIFNKKRDNLLKGRTEEELSQSEYNELMDINNAERKILRDDESLNRFIKKYYK